VSQPIIPPPHQQLPRGYPYPYDPPPPRRNWPLVAGVVVLFLIFLGALAGRSDSTSSTSQGSTFQQASSVDAPPPPTGPVTSFGAGTYAVSTDIVPGTYSSSGPDGSNFTGCYWARLKDTTGDFESIIANNIDKGPTVVTISASDGAFKTQGCSTWHKR
jgi:hypothetical protein